MLNLEHIRNICTGGISISEPLAPLTSFRIGGPADIYVEPANTAELAALVRYFRELDLPMLLLGNGSNILISDEGFRGVTISIEQGFSFTQLDGGVVTAGAGIRLSKFVDFCIGNGFALMEAQLVLATLRRRFRWTLAPGARIEPLPLLTLRCAHGVPARVEAV